jgi:RimJ/RimL family protein N-acetyltransferase
MHGRFCCLEPLDSKRHAPALIEELLHESSESQAVGAERRRWTYLPYGPFATAASYAAWLEEASGQEDPLFFAILGTSTSRALGLAAYLRITPASGAIEVGHLNFSSRLQRTPAATEAMFLMMKHAFELGYRRYEWKCDALNLPSRAAAQRLGLSFEGVFRQATVYKGRSRDTAWYAAIDSEWPALERAFTAWLAADNFDANGRQRLRLSDLTESILVRRG